MLDPADDAEVALPDRIAVVLPAYNEAEGLGDFLREIVDAVVSGGFSGPSLSLVVVDDASTDGTADVAAGLALDGVDLEVIRSPANRGHGPTALAAYRAGLATGAEWIVHVDGDGQFDGEAFPLVLRALGSSGTGSVRGVRMGRGDPFYRRVLTAVLTISASIVARRRLVDVNTPLRAYRRDVLDRLVGAVPPAALVPHVHFSILEARWGLRVRHLAVRSRPRRGASDIGTMWGAHRPSLLPPPSLRRFTRNALAEVLRARPWTR